MTSFCEINLSDDPWKWHRRFLFALLNKERLLLLSKMVSGLNSDYTQKTKQRIHKAKTVLNHEDVNVDIFAHRSLHSAKRLCQTNFDSTTGFQMHDMILLLCFPA
jgi:hypothetical protein